MQVRDRNPNLNSLRRSSSVTISRVPCSPRSSIIARSASRAVSAGTQSLAAAHQAVLSVHPSPPAVNLVPDAAPHSGLQRAVSADTSPPSVIPLNQCSLWNPPSSQLARFRRSSSPGQWGHRAGHRPVARPLEQSRRGESG